MNECYLGLGSNLKSPLRQLILAVRSINKLPSTYIASQSPIYKSKAWGIHSQPDFYNQVLKINTRLTPFQLLRLCQKIETGAGRIRKKKWGSRTLDIDILLYSHLEMNAPDLQIPHPYMLERDFVLQPLMDLDPLLKLPDNKFIKDYLQECTSCIIKS